MSHKQDDLYHEDLAEQRAIEADIKYDEMKEKQAEMSQEEVRELIDEKIRTDCYQSKVLFNSIINN